MRRETFAPGLFSVTFRAPALAGSIRPGQFVMVEVPARSRPYLRRAYSVADSDPVTGNVELLIKTIGAGTGALEELPETAGVRLLGPLGNAFDTSGFEKGERAAIVAGGIGAAPFPALLKALRQAGVPADFYLGGRNERELSIRRRFDGLVRGDTVLTSDDGSVGEKGFVTEALARRLEAGKRYARVFACGPMPMFGSLAKVVARAGVRAEFSTEAEMGCGFGVCLGCVIPAVDKPFIVSCTEGPILSPEKIRW